MDRNESQKSELMASLESLAEIRLGPARAADACRFMHHYFTRIGGHDLEGETQDALFAASMSLYGFAANRTPGAAKLRVFNPRGGEHGWRSRHTVIEIVNDDMPFLVDSVIAALNRRELMVHLLIHPIVPVRRDGEGKLLSVADAGAKDSRNESCMHVEVDERAAPAELEAIKNDLERVLADVRQAVADWRPTLDRMRAIAAKLRQSPPALAADEIEEGVAFLDWLADNHFTFIGARDIRFEGEGTGLKAISEHATGLGLLRDPDFMVFEELRDLGALPPEVRDYAMQPSLVTVTKASRRSTVHRPVYLDAVGIRQFDGQGRVVGLHLFVGLFTSTAYTLPPRKVPLLRRKIARTVARAGFRPDSHDGKGLAHVLDTFPRDELFQIGEDDLFETALGILQLEERQHVALFLRRDGFERFVSALIYVPRDRYTRELRLKFEAILGRVFAGEVIAGQAELGDSPLARLHLTVKTRPGYLPNVDLGEVERAIAEAARSWADRLQHALIAEHGEAKGLALQRRYVDAFSASYRESTIATVATADIAAVEQVIESGELGIQLYRPFAADENTLRLKIFHLGGPVPLSDALPILEAMGLKVIDETPHQVRPADLEKSVFIQDFGLLVGAGQPVDLASIEPAFAASVARVWRNEIESDGFNRLIFAGLEWREIAMIRAYCKYLRQAGIAYSQNYMEATLARHADVTRLIVELFRARLDPEAADREAHAEALLARIEESLEAVPSLDEDRILRRFLNLVTVTLRTNYFQTDAAGGHKPYMSFKLSSRDITDLPAPRPLYEIWVYSPRMEGVHLRGGKVARGGIRWSDRREDFRNEVLGLMKAQMVKNAVIVPVGAKGGFVLKRPPDGGREALQAEGIECYKILVRGLLDLTDNLAGGKIVPPSRVVRHDPDDPYLVVAADKGTATFSDIANGISREYGFWLDDAFASGGSAGYDHKGMGITARGAWEAVKRHFREIGIDIQSQPFTAAGVGDMSGDVFGNGMLRAPQTKLLAAFDHRHIFIDPDPDAAKSFAERERLFKLSRSSWADYDKAVLSAGGGTFERSAKSIKLSAQAQKLLGLPQDTVAPAEAMRAILKLPVDLVYFGGIGTYVKAASESQAEAGDKTNDGIRINGGELRAKVLVEGANLGLTQRGRVEYALAGGRINTDAIDNSAGVDCSDHEVNIKVLLNGVVGAGDLTLKQRDKLLVEMTDDVARLVLRDNYLQTQAISVAAATAVEQADSHLRLMRGLERRGRLDRALEFLPSDEALMERIADGRGLTRPELAVLLAYGKIALYDDLLKSDLPEDPIFLDDLARYFPKVLQERFRQAMGTHALRREIVSTAVTNSIINRTGPHFIFEMVDRTGRSAPDIAGAYVATREAYGLRDLWSAIQALDNRIAASTQTEMLCRIGATVERGTLWFLRASTGRFEIAPARATLAPIVQTLARALSEILTPEGRAELAARTEELVKAGVPSELAARVAGLPFLGSALEVQRIAPQIQGSEDAIKDAARIYFGIGLRFAFYWLRRATRKISTANPWAKMAAIAILEDLYSIQAELAASVAETPGGSAAARLESWAHSRSAALARVEQIVNDIRAAGTVDVAMLTVATRALRALGPG
jgi:glutamate dehydrogenase